MMLKSCTSGLMGALPSIRVSTAWEMFHSQTRTLVTEQFATTSHSKGPQDGAGANLKHKADMEIIKRKVIIQSVEDLFKFTENNLKMPASSRYQSDNPGECSPEKDCLW